MKKNILKSIHKKAIIFANAKKLFFLGLLFILYGTTTALKSNSYTSASPLKVSSSYACVPPAVNLATIQPTKSGSWNDRNIWPGNNLPTTNDDILIPSGITLTLKGTCLSKSITVAGKLMADNTKETGTGFNLVTKWIMVMGTNAVLEIGTKTKPYISTDGGIIALQGSDPDEKIPGTSINSKAIVVMDGATMNLHAAPRKSWVKIGAKTPIGSTTITLAETVDWEVGDQVVITPNRRNENETETRFITAVSADGKTISFADGLKFPRMGELKSYTNEKGKTWETDTRAEVGLLSRNLTIQGNASSASNSFGGHIMIMGGATGNADNVELYRMGQRGTLGRYPWHWHLLGEQGRGQYITNSSVHLSYNRAITVHGTRGTDVNNNVAYDHLGHGIFLEDGSEIENRFVKNLVLLTKLVDPRYAILDTDSEGLNQQFLKIQNSAPAAFWITNPDNTFIDNIVAGTEGTAYWFIMPDRPTGDSANIFGNMRPRETNLREFRGNVAHSSGNAWDSNDRLNSEHQLLTAPPNSFNGRNGAWDPKETAIIEDFTIFSCGAAVYAGIGSQKSNVIFDNLKSLDNNVHIMVATHYIIRNSIFVADSDNGLIDFSVFRDVDGDTNNDFGPIQMNRLYDGASRVFDSYLVNWDRDYVTIFSNNGAARKRINHQYRGITYNHSGTPRIDIKAFTANNNGGSVRTNANVIRDLDGSLTRTRTPNSIVSTAPFNVLESTYQPHNWKNMHSVSEKYIYFEVYKNQTVRFARKNLACEGTSQQFDIASGGGNFSQYHLVMDEGKYEHIAYFTDLDSSGDQLIEIGVRGDLAPGDDFTVRFRKFGNLNNISVSKAERKNSIQNVRTANKTAYYVENNGDLYVKFVTIDSNGMGLGARQGGPANVDTGYEIKWDGGRLGTLNVNENPDTIRAYVLTEAQSGCVARARLELTNNPNHNILEVSLDGGVTYAKTARAGRTNFSNVPVGTVIYARWRNTCNKGIAIGFVENNNPDCNPVIENNSPPVVNFVSPTTTEFVEGDDLGVTVEATDNGSVADVKLYINDILVRQEILAPYHWGTANASNEDSLLLDMATGTYILKAIATDNEGAASEKTLEITVTEKGVVFLSPIHDAYVENGTTGSVTGVLKIDPENQIGYMQFDLSSLPEVRTVIDAKLSITVEVEEGSGVLNVYEASHSNWDEDTIDANTAPQTGQLLDQKDQIYLDDQRLVFDVVNADYSTDKVSFIFQMPVGGNDVWLASGDNKIVTHPSLRLKIEENTLALPDINIDAQNTLTLYPNPAKNSLFISNTKTGQVIQLYDLLGAVKATYVLAKGTNTIDMHAFSTGLYLAKILDQENTNKKSKVYKILKVN